MTDTSAGPPVTPTGKVKVTGHKNDSITGSPCTLSGSGGTASCQVTYAPTAANPGKHTVTAQYPGDRYHTGSHTQITITETVGGTT